MKFIAAAAFGLLMVPIANASDFRFSYAREELVAPAQLLDRLEASVNEYCSQNFGLRSMGLRQLCRRNLMQITIEEIGHPTLTAYADTRDAGRSS